MKKDVTYILEIQVIKDSTRILFEEQDPWDRSVVYLTKSDKTNNKTVKTKLCNAVYTGLFNLFRSANSPASNMRKTVDQTLAWSEKNLKCLDPPKNLYCPQLFNCQER